MPLVAWAVLAYCCSLIVALNASQSIILVVGVLGPISTLACLWHSKRNSAAIGIIITAGTLIGGAASASTGHTGTVQRIAPVHAGSSGIFGPARVAAARRIDRIFGADAPMVRALVIADMSGIPAEVRDRYSRAGLVHMLSVSGLHVGIVALALELLASVFRLPATPSRIGTLVLLAAYVAAIGAPAPAVRAAVMLAAVLLTRILQRPTSPWAVLALGALTPLWDVRTAVDLGWQLSVAGTAALIGGGALARRVIPKPWSGWRRGLTTAMIVSIVATAVTAPLVAWTFGRVSLIGPVTNLAADPIMGLLQPLLFLALSVPLGPVESISADAAHALLLAFDGIARLAVLVPGSSPLVLPSALSACAAAVASISLIVACVSREPVRPAFIALVAIAVMTIEPVIPHRGADPELHMIDVGQGDAFALRTSRGRWIVIDAGRSWIGGDAGQSTVVPYIAHRGGEVALFILSHAHSDHVGGAASLFKLLHPKRFLDPGYIGTSSPYLAALAQAKAGRIPWQRVRPGESVVVDDIVLSELAPDSAWTAGLDDANLSSSVIMAQVGSARVLFTGDAEAAEENWLLDHYPNALNADVIKIAHHGSVTSSTSRFLDAVRPRIALISVGARNTYGHPGSEVITSLALRNVLTLRTDLAGSVVLRFSRKGIAATSNNERWFIAPQVSR